MESKFPRICVGVDPDIDEHGIAIYSNGKLIALHKWNTLNIVDYLHEIDEAVSAPLVFSIEDVNSNNFIYARNKNSNHGIEKDIARKIGKCQQAQIELMRWLESYGVKIVLHKPQKGNWADNKAQFEKVTGWTKQSNTDTRSAAFMGWLEVSK